MTRLRTIGTSVIALATLSLTAGGAFAQTTTASAKPLKPQYRNIQAYYRNIQAYSGPINPFYRNIQAYWGDINPFYRNIQVYWGDLNPLYRNIQVYSATNVNDYRNVGAFWEKTGGLWSEIDALAGAPATAATAAALLQKMNQLNQTSEHFFGARVVAAKGGTFDTSFANPLYAKFGIDPANGASIGKLSGEDRARFFMSYYDNLMAFSGRDHVDHWMKTANWTPRITQIQGSGTGTIIGLVDLNVVGDADIMSKTIYNGGFSTYSNGHGAAVGSLMVAAHDGRGVMGIAPNAKIAAFNPFDATGSADFASVKRGIVEVTNRGARVVNLSLGVPGSTLHGDWRALFASSEIKDRKDKTVYVLAAGNDGITQAAHVNWKDVFDSAFLVVGSVAPDGTISSFSNRPGKTCLLDDTTCKNSIKYNESGLLMNRFIVAPGELILVSDDKGGVTRHSGTSFAAPMVTGAIALLHDRWPWLKDKPLDTLKAILGSARDMGAPGIDEVYGVGMLDVEASQSPLNFAEMKYYQPKSTVTTTDVTTTNVNEVKVATVLAGGVQSSWETKSLYFSAFEKLDGAERDFAIPLSTRLVGGTLHGEQFQDFVYNRMVAWMKSPTGTSGSGGFTDFARRAQLPVRGEWGFSTTARLANNAAVAAGFRDVGLRTELHVDAPSGGLGFSVGQGDGFTLGHQDGFGLTSDYDTANGGVNPVLGFASGGAYASVRVEAAKGLQLTLGATQRNDKRSTDANTIARSRGNKNILAFLVPYEASAASVGVSYTVSPAVTVTGSYTRLDEGNGMLGVRSLDPTDLADGANTDAVTMGANVDVGRGLSLAFSATRSKTGSDGDAALRVAEGGLTGSAYQIAVAKERVLGRNDRVRLSLASPLSVSGGQVEFSSIMVTDRRTGEKGLVTQSFDAATKRRLVAEGLYGVSLLDGAGEFSAFGRGEIGNSQIDSLGVTFGGRFSLGF